MTTVAKDIVKFSSVANSSRGKITKMEPYFTRDSGLIQGVDQKKGLEQKINNYFFYLGIKFSVFESDIRYQLIMVSFLTKIYNPFFLLFLECS